MLFLPLLASLASAGDLALYWGQASAGSQLSLGEYCESSSGDIYIISFINTFGQGLQTSINVAGQSGPISSISLPSIGSDIQKCQQLGKKVLISLGGEAGSYGFNNDADASLVATELWNAFGGGSGINRPFGNAKVDGFDLDIENMADADKYVAFVNQLRALYQTDTSKSYYVSAAPQCPYPDASSGKAIAGAHMDFLFIQFYNNYCNLDSSWFNYDTWQQFASSSSPNPNVKLYIGLPGGPTAAGSGIVTIDQVKAKLPLFQNSANFGGFMVWDASQANKYIQNGETFAQQLESLAKGSNAQVAAPVNVKTTQAQTTPVEQTTHVWWTPETVWWTPEATTSSSSSTTSSTTSTSSTSTTVWWTPEVKSTETTTSSSSSSTTSATSTSSTSSTIWWTPEAKSTEATTEKSTTEATTESTTESTSSSSTTTVWWTPEVKTTESSRSSVLESTSESIHSTTSTTQATSSSEAVSTSESTIKSTSTTIWWTPEASESETIKSNTGSSSATTEATSEAVTASTESTTTSWTPETTSEVAKSTSESVSTEPTLTPSVKVTSEDTGVDTYTSTTETTVYVTPSASQAAAETVSEATSTGTAVAPGSTATQYAQTVTVSPTTWGTTTGAVNAGPTTSTSTSFYMVTSDGTVYLYETTFTTVFTTVWE